MHIQSLWNHLLRVRLQTFAITEKSEEKIGFIGARQLAESLEGLSLKCKRKTTVSSVAVRTVSIVSLFCL